MENSKLSQALQIKPDFSKMETSPIGLGLAAIGRPGYINLGHDGDLRDKSFVAMRQHAFDMLDTAYATGVRYFDTAASYGAGEQFLGEWIFQRGYHLEGLTAATKWGYVYTADWQVEAEHHEIKKHNLDNLNTSFVMSCLRLGKAMQVYQIHSATFESGVLENADVLNRLAEIRDDGRLIGLTVSGPRQAELIDKAIEIEIDGESLFRTVQATWNLLETSAGKALQRARDAGMAVIVKEAMANGRLTARNQAPDFQEKLARLKNVAGELGCTLDQLAMAAAVNQPWSNVVLSGAANRQQLESNWGALDVDWDDGIAGELESLVEEVGLYWDARAALQWN